MHSYGLRDVEKLLRKSGDERRIQVIFTVDGIGEGWGGDRLIWAPGNAESCLRHHLQDLPGLKRLPFRWELVACSEVVSPYFGSSTSDGEMRRRDGLFAAAFIELLS